MNSFSVVAQEAPAPACKFAISVKIVEILARHKGPQVVTVTLVDDFMSEYGGRIARHVLTKSSDLLFFAGPCTGGSSWARLNKTRGIDTAEKIEAKQKEFWKLFGRFVEIKRHAMTNLFELPGSCDYWKDERLHEVVHDGTNHEFDGCRYGLKPRYAKKPLPIKKPWRVVSWNFELWAVRCLRNVAGTMNMDLVLVGKLKKPSYTRH